jgi:hypothetical protein
MKLRNSGRISGGVRALGMSRAVGGLRSGPENITMVTGIRTVDGTITKLMVYFEDGTREDYFDPSHDLLARIPADALRVWVL